MVHENARCWLSETPKRDLSRTTDMHMMNNMHEEGTRLPVCFRAAVST